MENRLKKDVLAEATRYGNRVLVNKETDDGKVEDVWESVGEGSVLTPKQVFERLKAEGFDVEAIRVPVTDEKAPKVQDFDELAANCAAAAEEGTALLFNCQMGRGRTTTAMVVASLVHLRLNPRTLPLPPLTRPPQPGAGAHPGDDALLRGEYGVVRSLLRVLDAGNAAKEQVDEARALAEPSLRSGCPPPSLRVESRGAPSFLRLLRVCVCVSPSPPTTAGD